MKWKREHEIGILSMRDNEENFWGFSLKIEEVKSRRTCYKGCGE